MSGPIKIPKSGFADPGKKFWNNSSEDSPPAKRLKKTELFCYAYEMKKKKKKTPRAKVRIFFSNYGFASFHNFHTFRQSVTTDHWRNIIFVIILNFMEPLITTPFVQYLNVMGKSTKARLVL